MYRLLIVEDDAVMRSALTLSLKGAGYEVEAAENGLKALERAQGKSFDCIISDIRMPGLDGVTMVSRFKEIFPRIKTILITGYSDDEPLVRAINLGVDGLLKKPFGMKELLRAVSLKLEEKEAEQAREEKLQCLVSKLSQTLGKTETEEMIGDAFPLRSQEEKTSLTQLATLVELGRMAEIRQEFEAALQAYEEALSLVSSSGSDKEEFPIRLALSNLFAKRNEKELSLLHASEALAIANKINEPSLLVEAHLHFGKLCFSSDPEESLKHMEEGKKLLEESRSREKQALSLLLLSGISLEQGKRSEAREAMAEFLSIGKRHFLPQILISFQEIGIRPLLLCLEEEIEPETTSWILEEAAPFIQEKLRQFAREKAKLESILARFLSTGLSTQKQILQIFAFGKLAMLLDSRQLPESCWKSIKGRSLFLYLLHHYPKLVSEEHLLDTFWPNLDPEKGRHTFRTTLYFIRRTLGEGSTQKGDRNFLYCERQKFGIRVESGIYCDFLNFKQYCEKAKREWEKGDKDHAVSFMREAEKIYKGSFLEGWSEEWCLTARDDYMEAFIWILLSLAGYLKKQGQWNETLLYAQKALQLDPVLEEAHFLAMESFLEIGKREDAIKQFQACKSSLGQELNVEPSEKTRLLYLKAVGSSPVKNLT